MPGKQPGGTELDCELRRAVDRQALAKAHAGRGRWRASTCFGIVALVQLSLRSAKPAASKYSMRSSWLEPAVQFSGAAQLSRWRVSSSRRSRDCRRATVERRRPRRRRWCTLRCSARRSHPTSARAKSSAPIPRNCRIQRVPIEVDARIDARCASACQRSVACVPSKLVEVFAEQAGRPDADRGQAGDRQILRRRLDDHRRAQPRAQRRARQHLQPAIIGEDSAVGQTEIVRRIEDDPTVRVAGVVRTGRALAERQRAPLARGEAARWRCCRPRTRPTFRRRTCVAPSSTTRSRRRRVRPVRSRRPRLASSHSQPWFGVSQAPTIGRRLVRSAVDGGQAGAVVAR